MRPSSMKELSLFLVKNSLGSKMKKGFRNLCNGESSTSTLHQHKSMAEPPLISASSPPRQSHPTLEEMILQLEMEEKNMGARKGGFQQHRMSCVNSSDILRSARNALNQYPRFSLDGKDAMYRSSFTDRAGKLIQSGYDLEAEKLQRLPGVIGGESVVWCKPGVVGRLMGLEAMPVPLNSSYRRERLSAIIKTQNLRKRVEKQRRRSNMVGSCSRTSGYCVINPRDLDIPCRRPGFTSSYR